MFLKCKVDINQKQQKSNLSCLCYSRFSLDRLHTFFDDYNNVVKAEAERIVSVTVGTKLLISDHILLVTNVTHFTNSKKLHCITIL